MKSMNSPKYAWRKRIAEVQAAETEEGEAYLRDQRPSAEEQMLKEEQNRMIRKAVDTLPERLKTVVLLYYFFQILLCHTAPFPRCIATLHSYEGVMPFTCTL